MNRMKKLLTVGFIIYVMVLTACQQKNSGISPSLIENPASAEGKDKDVKVPVFKFDEIRFHFGEVSEGDELFHSFKFENTGNADLVISDVATTCGCTVASYSKDPIKPGDNGEIQVKFDTKGKSGMQSKTITVLANTIPASKVLTISAEVFPRK